MTLVDGKLLASGRDTTIAGFASLKEARAGDLSFFHDHRYEARLRATQAERRPRADRLRRLPGERHLHRRERSFAIL